jgi:BirA family transcriptional regulator, biotin operon repressor / biotin---[acetyl-CoA-carboxylase] ligase
MVTGMRGDRARPLLAGTRFADLRWVDQTGSTNRDLVDLAASGAPDGVVLVADHQTAGRGRLDRTWVAPSGASLLVSVLVRPQVEPTFVPLLTVAMALAVIDGAAGRHVAARLKWPNDVVVDADPPRKLAGILAESMVDGQGSMAVVVGVGINVNWPTPPPAELASLTQSATALNLECGATVSREELLVAVLAGFEERCRLLEAGGPGGRARLIDAARQASVTLGRRVRADLGGRSVEGTAVNLDERGDLIVADDDGARHVITAGDVIHLRPAP